MSRVRVLLVDDHAVVREGIRALLALTEEIEVVGEAGDGYQAIEQARLLQPDVVLMDIAMPGFDGIDATGQIKKEVPEAKVLVLSQHDNKEYVLRVLKAGASGYVLKRAVGLELVSAIMAAQRGETFLHSGVAKTVVDSYLAYADDANEPRQAQLTNREREVLKLVAEGHSNQEIASFLCLSVKTVMAHRTNIMEKLNVHNRTELVKYAIRTGLIQV